MFDLFEDQCVSQVKFLKSTMSLPVSSKRLSEFKTSAMSSTLLDSASPAWKNLDMPTFIERSNIRHSLKHTDCNDTFTDCDLTDQAGDSEDDLLTVHFGDVAKACTEEPIVIDSEEEISEDNMFVCGICTRVCKNAHSLKQHEMTHSEETQTTCTEEEMSEDILFVCSVCTVVCANLHSLKQHEMTHSEEVHTTYSEDQSAVYSEVENSENNMFVCSVCTAVYNNLQSLKYHEMTHLEDMCTSYSGDQNTLFSEAEINENNMFVCGVCTMVCKNLYSLKCHEMTHSEEISMAYSELQHTDFFEAEINDDNMYVCGVCSMVCKNIQSLTRHEMTHSDDRPYKCSFCNYAGKHKENLIAHINTHTREKQFKCQHCDYTCIKSYSLKLHQQFHTDKYPHKCGMCLYSTVSLGNLTSHCKNHHRTITEHTSVEKLALSEANSDKCSQALNPHMHVQEKIHRCQYCDYSSPKPYSLKRHMQAHTDKFPNKCHLCLYSTANPGNLTSHYKNHHLNNFEDQNTPAEELDILEPSPSEPNREKHLEELNSSMDGQEKTYTCPYCDYSAPKPYRIRDHMQYHTDIFPNKCQLCMYSTTRSGSLLYHYRYHHHSNAEAMTLSAELAPSPIAKVKACKTEPNLSKLSPARDKLYKCEHCEYIAIKRYRLKEHSHFHTYKYPNKCTMCVYSTTNLGNLTSHYRNHHRSVTEGKDSFEKLVHTKPNWHSSQTCGKLKNLTVCLERISELANYFVCDVCQKIFVTKPFLTEHKKTHLEVCKYKCDICECSFFESKLLETHKESHQKEGVKQPTNSSEIGNNGLLCKSKLRTVKSYAMASAQHKARIISSKLQLNKRKSVKNSSLRITAEKLERRCKLVLLKLDKSKSLQKEIQRQSGIVSADKTDKCISLSKSNKDKQSLNKAWRSVSKTTEALSQHGKRWSLKNCVVKIVGTKPVKIVSTKPEILSKIQLHRCLLCEFAGTSSHSLKVHIDSHHKKEASLEPHRESNHKNERSLKPHNEECSHKADCSLTLHKESNQKVDTSLTLHNKSHLKEKINLKSKNTSDEKKELSLKLNTESKQKVYSCNVGKYTCKNVQDFRGHMEEHSDTEIQNTRLDEEAEISTESHYTCDMCGFSCDQLALLHRHLPVHDKERKHVLRRRLPGNEEGNASSSKKTVLFKCVLCRRKSADVESMTKHMLTCNTKKGLW